MRWSVLYIKQTELVFMHTTRLPTVLSSGLCLITKCKQIRCVLVMLLAIHMFLWTATFAAFMVTVRHALNVCKLSTYPVMQQLRKLQLSSAHFPVLLQNNIPVHFAIKQHINKSKTRVLCAAISWMKAVSCFCGCAWMNLPHRYWVLDCDAALLPWQRSAACLRQCSSVL